MRSILAGLRQLIVPWGARTAPRVVIGGEDPLVTAAGLEAGIAFYVSDDQGFVHAVNVDGSDFPNYNFFTASLGSSITARILDVTYQLSLERVDTVEIAADNVGSLQLGVGQGVTPGAESILLGHEDSRLFFQGRQIAFNEVADNQPVSTASGNTALAAFAAVPGVPTATFTKTGLLTRARLELHITGFAAAAGIRPAFGIRLDDGAGTVVDTELCGWPVSFTGREQFSGVDIISLAPATYTVTVIWRKVSGPAGNVSRLINDDACSFAVSEVTEA